MKNIIMSILMNIVTICIYISYIPQIVQLLKTKKSEDISTLSYLIGLLSAICNTIYSFMINRLEIIIASVSELLMILLALILIIKYKK